MSTRWLFAFSSEEDPLDWIGSGSFSATEHCRTPGIPSLGLGYSYVTEHEGEFICVAETETAQALVALLHNVEEGHGWGSLGLAALRLARHVASDASPTEEAKADAALLLAAAGE